MKKKGLKKVAPGVMINTKRFKVGFLHPDPCWVIQSIKKNAKPLASRRPRYLYVFSTEEIAKDYTGRIKLEGVVTKRYTWDELVDRFGRRYKVAFVNPKPESGFCATAPLKKDMYLQR